MGGSNRRQKLIRAQQDQVLGDLKAHPPTGRMVIHIRADIGSWANTEADIELRRGDVLTIPRRPGLCSSPVRFITPPLSPSAPAKLRSGI